MDTGAAWPSSRRGRRAGGPSRRRSELRANRNRSGSSAAAPRARTLGVVAASTVQEYVAAIPPQHRPLFDRVQQLVLDACPDAEVVLAYGMPTYRRGKRRLHLGVWKHGVSLYGWRADAFLARHPHLQTSKGTIRLREQDAEFITDAEIRDLARVSLEAAAG
jgi:uncharacterized protein YdhG (YjbR/CyaY superfamily)